MVSIVVPVYNVEDYIRCCLESIVAQTYYDYEVIMVDDGSSDKSASICEEFVNRDSRFYLICQKNKGVASARNTGIKKAKGQYIFFIDSDDCINSNLLKILVDIAEKENANIVQVAFKEVPSDFVGYNEPVDLDEIFKATIKMTAIDCMYQLEISKTSEQRRKCLCTAVVWNKLYRVSQFDSLLFPEGMRIHEDQMVSHRNIIASDGITFVDFPLYYYRKAEGSLIRVGWTPKRLAILECYEDRIKRIHIMSVGKEEKAKLLDFVFYRYLVCIFRNYEMAEKKLQGEERKQTCQFLKNKMKDVYNSKQGKLKFSRRLFFKLFIINPSICVSICRIFDRLRKK